MTPGCARCVAGATMAEEHDVGDRTMLYLLITLLLIALIVAFVVRSAWAFSLPGLLLLILILWLLFA
jgi:hypothetical protein